MRTILVAMAVSSLGVTGLLAEEAPSIPVRRDHIRALVGNALEYVRPSHGLFDPASGYPCEGWNDDSAAGLHLRDFTQLTAIGAWLELLGQMAAGAVPAGQPTALGVEGRSPASPCSRGLEGERPRNPLSELEHVTDSLLADQRDPRLAMHGLLCNFMGFEADRRVGPLASEAFRNDFLAEFGPDTGAAIWRALKARGWVRAWQDDQAGEIRREDRYGKQGFDGALAPYATPELRDRILALLDRRTVQLIFGDNANLAASVAKTAGALLAPAVREQPEAVRVRGKLEQFLEAQRPGYDFLYDAQRGLFRFGWNAENRRFVGWGDGQGAWQVGYADYLVNEFRGPTEFVTLRYGFPTDAVRNLGFRIRSRRAGDGRERFTLAPWEGSAFQSWGLSLFMDELASPGWRAVLENAVRIHLDYARQHGLPGFLSESYSGDGNEYAGRVGIPELAVVEAPPRITNAPSLYTLGVAYEILPREIERFLGERWPDLAVLLTPHGPWEGMRLPERRPIERQTTAHVLSLILGAVGQSPAAMARYLDSRGLRAELARLRPRGERVDFLGGDARAATWSAQGAGVWGQRTWRGYRVSGTEGRQGAVTWTFPSRGGEVSLSNGELVMGYRTLGPGLKAVLRFEGETVAGQRYGNEVVLKFPPAPGRGTWRIPLPATPALTGLRRGVLSFQPEGLGRPDLFLTTFRFLPWGDE